jgi:GntR family hexuronate regulon transcriptional repressor
MAFLGERMSSKRLYQSLGEQIRELIISGKYPVGQKLPPERLIAEEFNVSRTVVREAIIMLELEGYVEVRKGSGIMVVSSKPETNSQPDDEFEQFVRQAADELRNAGPFEMLQARQLIECTIAGFAASQVTKGDLDELTQIWKAGVEDEDRRDSKWDREFHYKLANITNNSVLEVLVKLMWFGREQNPLWLKLHEHIDSDNLNAWDDEHNQIMNALLMKSPEATKKAMWSHLESTKQALYEASSTEDNPYDKFLFQDDPTKCI